MRNWIGYPDISNMFSYCSIQHLIIRYFCSLHVVYYMLNPQHVKRLFMGNVVGFHLAYFARSTPCLLNRVANAPESKIVKLVFEELHRLGDQGFQAWIGKACELANSCGIESNMITSSDKDEFKYIINRSSGTNLSMCGNRNSLHRQNLF